MATIRLLLLLMAALAAAPSPAQDVDRGRDVNEPCAGCHGAQGQGGKRGEYPRLAGQRVGYLESQLYAYRDRKRHNMPMFPYTQERELSDQDIRDVSAYLASIKLSSRVPDFKDSDDALTRLTAMDKVMIIPRVAGDLDNGRSLYERDCAACHMATGMGRAKIPMLVGQYTNYLRRQMDLYRQGERAHDEDDPAKGVLNGLQEKDLQDILAYLTSIQERE